MDCKRGNQGVLQIDEFPSKICMEELEIKI